MKRKSQNNHWQKERNDVGENTLNKIQKELKAPKGQKNTFGNYRYRSCEDILEAVKPLLGKATLTLCDDIVLIGDRYYVKATATLCEDGGIITATAYARESLDKKGMDSAQITGAASSYARKYALNGLFCIDDTKDADHDNNGKDTDKPKAKPEPPNPEENKGAKPSPAMDAHPKAIIRTAAMEKSKKIMAELFPLYATGEPEAGCKYDKGAFAQACEKVLGHFPETAEDKEKLEAELPKDCAMVWA
jgi:hypothetical protein